MEKPAKNLVDKILEEKMFNEFLAGIIVGGLDPFRAVTSKMKIKPPQICERAKFTDLVGWNTNSKPYLTGKVLAVAGYAALACYIISQIK